MPSVIHRNHLIIGLGGTGGNIIRALRKTIYQNFRAEDPSNVNLRYLYVDTSRELMAPDDPTWKILGHSVQLPERSQMAIEGLDLRQVLNNLPSYPGIQPWLGNKNDWDVIINSSDAANIFGGQKRRLGRFLFACKAAEFRRRVSELVVEMQQHNRPNIPRSNEITFHVLCGLAGGTGSGSVVDALAQIRSLYSDSTYRIIVYALLPERYPSPKKATTPYYQANGYAALLELNALSLGLWKPHDVTGVRSGERLDLRDPFNCCYLFNDENEANITVNVSEELPEIVAAFLFQKIIEIQNIEWGETNTLLRQELYENCPHGKMPELSPKQKKRRTRQFFSFGIKQIAYPEVEIREYLSYSFARQAGLQLLFNNWADGKGYQEEASNQSFAEYVNDQATWERWYLTDERLTLSQGILSDEEKNQNWQPIVQYWRLVVPRYMPTDSELKTKEKPALLYKFNQVVDDIFTGKNTVTPGGQQGPSGYRGCGVLKFYEMKRSDMRDQVREIRGRIESDLFKEWINGKYSMADISRLLAALLANLQKRYEGMDDRIVKLGENSELYRQIHAKMIHNAQEWAKPGLIAALFGKLEEILKAQTGLLIDLYTMKTREAGFRYAKDLLSNLIQELNGLASEISRASATISEASKEFLNNLNARVNDKGNQDLTRQVIRFYDPERVQAFTKTLSTDMVEQKRQTAKVRGRIAEELNDKLNFTAFNARISLAFFKDVLAQICDDNAFEAHEQYVGQHPDGGRVLKASLMDLLQREYDGKDETLRGYATNIMAMAKNYLKLDPAQVQLVAPGIPAANDSANAICLSNLTIIAPEAPESKAFRDKFCNALRNATASTAQIVTNKNRESEITIINITNIFPARMVSVVDVLRKQYEERIKDKKSYLELHSEGDDGKLPDGQEMPSLYPETYKAEDLRPWVMIAQALNLITIDKDPQTGIEKCYMVSKDEYGLPVVSELASSVESLIENADVSTFETLHDSIETLLRTEYLHQDKRKQIFEDILVRVQGLSKTYLPNDPVFQKIRAAMVRAKEILGVQQSAEQKPAAAIRD